MTSPFCARWRNAWSISTSASIASAIGVVYARHRHRVLFDDLGVDEDEPREALARLHLAGDGFALTRRNALSVGGWRPLFGMSAEHHEPSRLSGPLAALFMGLGAIPFFLWTRDAPRKDHGERKRDEEKRGTVELTRTFTVRQIAGPPSGFSIASFANWAWLTQTRRWT